MNITMKYQNMLSKYLLYFDEILNTKIEKGYFKSEFMIVNEIRLSNQSKTDFQG